MRYLIVVAIALSCAAPVHADASRDALAQIAKCADIADAGARLRCFDAALPGVKQALAGPGAPTPAAEEKSFLEWFGFAKPNPVKTPEEFGKAAPAPEPGEVTQIAAGVIELTKNARGKAFFILDNGQVWRQIDADSTMVFDPPAGTKMKVTIAKGFLSSFNLTIAGLNGLIKVTRIR